MMMSSFVFTRGKDMSDMACNVFVCNSLLGCVIDVGGYKTQNYVK